MITILPSSCLYAVHGLKQRQHAIARLAIVNHTGARRFHTQQQLRDSQSPRKSTPITQSLQEDQKHSVAATESIELQNAANPPASFLPPHLALPTRGSESTPVYIYRLGRAYGTFYKEGLKAVWNNRKLANKLKERIVTDLKAQSFSRAVVRDVAARKAITRAEFQILERNAYDVGKLPVFGVLVLIFGEWLPLLVPFMPGVVPVTCRIPKQINGMRDQAEMRRRVCFRSGIKEPSKEQLAIDDSSSSSNSSPSLAQTSANPERIELLLKSLRHDQLWHLSCALNLHARLWDRIQLFPPAFWLKRKLTKKIESISIDDILLKRAGGAKALVSDEVVVACEDRAMDVRYLKGVQGDKDQALRKVLDEWLENQKLDKHRGSALMYMLFRRPNAWNFSGSKAESDASKDD